MITVSPEALLIFHIDSIGPLVGLVIMGFFWLFTVTFFSIAPDQRLLRSMIYLNLALLVYLAGLTFYISGKTLWQVDFWSRVCYSGIALVAPVFTQLVYALMGKHKTKTVFVFLFISLTWVALIWLSDTLVITHEMRPLLPMEHPSMIKGPGLIWLLIYLYGVVGWAIWRLIGFYRVNAGFRVIGLPLLIGFIFWLLISILDGLGAANLLVGVKPLAWLGPCVMVLMMGIYYARVLTDRNRALAKAVAEKEQIYQQMIRDDLTGAFSRNFLMTVLDEVLRHLSDGPETVHSLLFIDIDNLKVINDRLGHAVGDDALKQAVIVFQGACRKSDVVARLGGDEFVVLLRDCPRNQAIQIARQILVKFHLQVAGLANVKPGLSIGVVSSPGWNAQAVEAIRVADEAMYYAKTHGKNQIAWWDGEKFCVDPAPVDAGGLGAKALIE